MFSDFKNEILQIKTLLTNAKHPLIIIKENPSLDALAASLALYICLKNAGRDCSIVCSSDLTVEVSNLIRANEVKKEFAGKQLLISWDYTDGSIEKVSYNIENNKFNLIIHPREGRDLEITQDKVSFQNTGISADLIIVINSTNLLSLGKLYTQEQEMYSKIDIINIDNDLSNENFGKVNLIAPLISSCSEVVGQLILELGIKLDQDAATNILTSIDYYSQNLTSEKVTPETLDVAAWCMRNGAIRINSKKPIVTDAGSAKAINEVIKIDKSAEQKPDGQDDAPSPDWLQPKIYRGTSMV